MRIGRADATVARMASGCVGRLLGPRAQKRTCPGVRDFPVHRRIRAIVSDGGLVNDGTRGRVEYAPVGSNSLAHRRHDRAVSLQRGLRVRHLTSSLARLA